MAQKEGRQDRDGLEELDILQGLSPVEFAEVRALVIDMVLATDMSAHFEHVKQMRLLLSAPDSASLLTDEHRSKVLCLLLHTADISHPGKPWETHTQWTDRITDEFFRQGDWEKELALPLSPLCDRSTTPLTESQIGFMDYIVSPIFDVCGDMLELLSSSSAVTSTAYSRPWLDNHTLNRERWLAANTYLDKHAEEGTLSDDPSITPHHKLSTCRDSMQQTETESSHTLSTNSSDSSPHPLQNGHVHSPK